MFVVLYRVIELTGDVSPDAAVLRNADVIVTTPEKWDGVSRSWRQRNYVRQIALIVIDEIHMVGEDRGPVIEVGFFAVHFHLSGVPLYYINPSFFIRSSNLLMIILIAPIRN